MGPIGGSGSARGVFLGTRSCPGLFYTSLPCFLSMMRQPASATQSHHHGALPKPRFRTDTAGHDHLTSLKSGTKAELSFFEAVDKRHAVTEMRKEKTEKTQHPFQSFSVRNCFCVLGETCIKLCVGLSGFPCCSLHGSSSVSGCFCFT